MKLRHIVMLAIFFCLAAVYSASAYEAEIKKMSATMAEKIAVTKKAKIAVVDFTDLQGDVTELGRFIAEEFSVALVNNSTGKGFKVVDRTHLKSIIKENKLSATGLIDPATARKLGKIAGVDALITGTLTPFGDSVRITAKVLESSTAEVTDAIAGDIAKTEAVKVLLATSLTPGDIGKGKPRKSLQTLEAGGFIFQLMKCELSNGTITFSFLITSPGKDKEIGMYGNRYSRLFDYEGNEYGATEAQIGYTKGDGYIDKVLVSDIPVKASISFGGVPPKITGIALLEINCNKFKVQFRKVPLAK
ncbi:MAG: hypothetical protein D3918_03150 [Candidatus Electrothrix sp. AX2]|nr:hypothetical protein [Candidatus Electrothrix gigas]